MTSPDPLEPDEQERQDKINRRLMLFGVLAVLFSFLWHVVSAFLAGGG